ncbi:MAG: hypothetical protein JWM12_3015 [Ilumatobacteraceae bacterium]|nr:hypothetical protein [Ilumatobacteraceae bacterium]
MPVLGPEHDLAHPVEGDAAWSESYYFNCYDPDVDCGFYTRVGLRPNEGTIDVGLALWVPGGELARLGHRREQHEMIDRRLEVGPVTYELVEPMTRWRLTCDGDARRHGHVAMDVTFDALMPAIGGDGQRNQAADSSSAATRLSVGKGHLEQAGRWSGWIEIDGNRVELGDKAMGNRDKSWGPRRWGGPTMWRWFSINVDAATHFGGIVIGTEGGDLHRGWVWKDGAHESIAEWRVTSELDDDGVTHRKTLVTAVDKAGREHDLVADVIRVEPGTAGIAPSTTIVNEGLALWTYEGRTGTGISEYLHQLDANARPVVPIA